jgi:hypothetical protein
LLGSDEIPMAQKFDSQNESEPSPALRLGRVVYARSRVDTYATENVAPSQPHSIKILLEII